MKRFAARGFSAILKIIPLTDSLLSVIINKIKEISREEVERCLGNNIMEWQVLKNGVRKSVEQLLYHKTKRRPIVFPIIMEV